MTKSDISFQYHRGLVPILNKVSAVVQWKFACVCAQHSFKIWCQIALPGLQIEDFNNGENIFLPSYGLLALISLSESVQGKR